MKYSLYVIFELQRIIVPHDAAYIEIADDNKDNSNKLQFPETDMTVGNLVEAGRVVVVTNSDKNPTSGDAIIPSGATVVFVNNGEKFVAIDALNAPISHLDGVKSLRAADDLDIGNFSLTAGGFVLSTESGKVSKNSVLTVGANGAIRGASGLLFSKNVLSVPGLAVDRLTTDVDAQYHSIE